MCSLLKCAHDLSLSLLYVQLKLINVITLIVVQLIGWFIIYSALSPNLILSSNADIWRILD